MDILEKMLLISLYAVCEATTSSRWLASMQSMLFPLLRVSQSSSVMGLHPVLAEVKLRAAYC